MVEVRFYDRVDDHLLQFAVIVAQTRGKWVFCKHRERDTYEVPGDVYKRQAHPSDIPKRAGPSPLSS